LSCRPYVDRAYRHGERHKDQQRLHANSRKIIHWNCYVYNGLIAEGGVHKVQWLLSMLQGNFTTTKLQFGYGSCWWLGSIQGFRQNIIWWIGTWRSVPSWRLVDKYERWNRWGRWRQGAWRFGAPKLTSDKCVKLEMNGSQPIC